ncbi:N-acetylmuramoyl-L-alanine amidase [Anaerosalibacter massiliensis]|uniref:N-acetylmuramoyl-L-alanine amidase n=1 Tax=Anaerosalibacter massiliensis TaxID=1347392 RepID=A0A9X2S4V1_9FIRM|nr:N-acetylmuramoyl-L-alanine amidase [Anaerosalibacter massiliensis]MCR2044025.1 N-acetylmuramoyl-L-alanine amidase [Anaerosalibacter massiliensis]
MKMPRIRTILFMIILLFIILQLFYGLSFLIGRFFGTGNIIIVDPGHGGKDSGTIGINNSFEKNINLDISKKLSKRLKLMGYKVILTRNTDEYVDNNQRANLANRKKAKVFISIHCNSVENNSNANGVQVLYYPSEKNNNDVPGNELLAQTILDEVLKSTKANNKGIVERKDLIVLNQTNMPAMIVECGFLSNEDEANLLEANKYQNKIVDGIINGLENYFNYK